MNISRTSFLFLFLLAVACESGEPADAGPTVSDDAGLACPGAAPELECWTTWPGCCSSGPSTETAVCGEDDLWICPGDLLDNCDCPPPGDP
ncbi:MAG: hypothetical protein AB8I08_02130 [Sandaracinaceae bacterium]